MKQVLAKLAVVLAVVAAPLGAARAADDERERPDRPVPRGELRERQPEPRRSPGERIRRDERREPRPIERRLEPRPIERRPEPRRAAEKPVPLVLQFQHISAQSFMDTLKQLGRNEAVGELLRKLPVALNEEANAVVFLAPPEAARILAAIAKGLDRPNEFRERMRQREREQQELHMRLEMMKRQMEARPAPRPSAAPALRRRAGSSAGMPRGMEWQPVRPGAAMPGQPMQVQPMPGQPMPGMMRLRVLPQPTWSGRPAMPGSSAPAPPRRVAPHRPGMAPEPINRAKQPERPGAEMRGRLGQGTSRLEAMASQRVAEHLKLDSGQVEKIREILRDHAAKAAQLMRRGWQAAEQMPPEQRREKLRELWEKIAAEHNNRTGELRKRIFQVLTPAQRKAAEQWLKQHAGGRREPAGPERGSPAPKAPPQQPPAPLPHYGR